MKHTTIAYLSTIEDKDTITVDELIQRIKTNNEINKTVEEAEHKTTCEEFKDRYLLDNDPNALFGSSITVYRIATIEHGAYETPFTRCYRIHGECLKFSENHFTTTRCMTSSASDLMTAEKLRSMTSITKDQFYAYKADSLRLQKELQQIVDRSKTTTT